jgi:hypothetical protein
MSTINSQRKVVVNMLKSSQRDFIRRHIGPSEEDQSKMLNELGFKSLDDLISKTVPENILLKEELDIGEPNSEYEALRKLKAISKKNKIYSNFIGMGYYGTFHSICYFKKYFRKSRLVHILHSISARSCTRKIGNAC